MSWFGGEEKTADTQSQPQAAPKQEGVGFITEAVIEGIVLASGGAPIAIAAMLVAHGLGHDPAIWIYFQKKFGNQKTAEIKTQVDTNGKAPATPETKPEAAKPDYKAFCAAFPAADNFAKCMGSFPGGMTEELVPQYFTAPQVADLTSFMSSGSVPPNLFHQASGPKLTAQQRIILSGVILAKGTVPPELQSKDNESRDTPTDAMGKSTGKKDGKLHATMCGHWAQQVYLYAGANTGAHNNAVWVGLETVDSGGTMHLGNADNDKSPWDLQKDKNGLALDEQHQAGHDAWEAKEDAAQAKAEAEGKQYKRKPNPWVRRGEMGEEVFGDGGLNPGDWIYLYNGNADSTGEHSEIFVSWDGPIQKSPTDKPYRIANVMSQMNPGDGGKQHQQKVGIEYELISKYNKICPITSVQRVKADAGELMDANTLVKPDAELKNATKLADKKVDSKKLREFLTTKASGELAELAKKKLDVKQQQMFQSAINSAGDESPHSIALLVACCQRMNLNTANANGYVEKLFSDKELVQFKSDT